MKDERLGAITDLIVRLGQGDLSARGLPTGVDDEVDAIVVGLNMLAEQLEQSQQTLIRLDRLAHRDPLTGLANRHALELELARRTSVRVSQDSRFALVYLDLDSFKPVNDEFGHAAGDRVLCTVGARLTRQTRGTDLAARVGGDEFAVLMSVPCDSVAQAILRRILSSIAEPIFLERPGAVEVSVVASGGLALWPEDGADAAELMRTADKRMYEAKRSHRARSQIKK